jgi:hypothetical protein
VAVWRSGDRARRTPAGLTGDALDAGGERRWRARVPLAAAKQYGIPPGPPELIKEEMLRQRQEQMFRRSADAADERFNRAQAAADRRFNRQLGEWDRRQIELEKMKKLRRGAWQGQGCRESIGA